MRHKGRGNVGKAVVGDKTPTPQDIRRIVDDFDAVLEEDAEEFLKSYVQRSSDKSDEDEQPGSVRRLGSRDETYEEHQARRLLLQGEIAQASILLRHLVADDRRESESLRKEFGYLLTGPSFSASTIDRRAVIEQIVALWRILSPDHDLAIPKEAKSGPRMVTIGRSTVAESAPEGAGPTTQRGSRPVSRERSRRGSGPDLEDSVMGVLANVFALSHDDEAFLVERLRKQSSGQQFGHDIEFYCSVQGSSVRVHVECKNYQTPIALADVAHKLAQEERRWPETRIDHWVLISPHTDAANELDDMLHFWGRENKYPFRIQVWSPQSNVQSLFSLDEQAYRQVFGGAPGSWPSERERASIIARWRSLLPPLLRLEPVWERYVSAPGALCFASEDRLLFEDLYRRHIVLGATDDDGVRLPGTLESNVRKWLEEGPEAVLLLLGDFGDGKTLFTYMLTRRLLEERSRGDANVWLPLRLALRDYYSAGDARRFLERRLAEIGATLEGWRRIARAHPTFVILDGFDEMSTRLDHETQIESIKAVAQCVQDCGAAKTLITCRTSLFRDRRSQTHLLERLSQPAKLHVARIARSETIEYLESYAARIGASSQLISLKQLYDPIGLAMKPLFLEMIQATLQALPTTSFDEVTLYEAYSRQSLERKLELLEDPERRTLPSETLANLDRLLETVATELHQSNGEYVFLRDGKRSALQGFGDVLWRMSGGDEGAQGRLRDARDQDDAEGRVRIRSLLVSVPGADQQRWPVNFFHRSMREYYVARAVTRAIVEDSQLARDLLAERLGPEIVSFIVGLLRRPQRDHDREMVEASLASLAHSAILEARTGARGGNALTILFRLAGRLPGKMWEGLNLDYAHLAGADLSHMRFRGSSLRWANLDNVNLEGTDLRGCDLTGVRLEETAAVQALDIQRDSGRIIVAYGDGNILEWGLEGTVEPTRRVVTQMPGEVLDTLISLKGAGVGVISEGRLAVHAEAASGNYVPLAEFGARPQIRKVEFTEDALFVLDEGARQGEGHAVLVDGVDGRVIAAMAWDGEGIGAPFGRDAIALSESDQGLRVVAWQTDGTSELMIPGRESLLLHDSARCLATQKTERRSEWLLAAGYEDGILRVWLVTVQTGAIEERAVFERKVHQGPINAVAFAGRETVVSGGTDRMVAVSRIDRGSGSDPARALQLTLRCHGVQIDGLSGPHEYKLLKALKAREEGALQQ